VGAGPGGWSPSTHSPIHPMEPPKVSEKELRVWMKKKRNNKILKFLDPPLVSSALTPSRPSSAP